LFICLHTLFFFFFFSLLLFSFFFSFFSFFFLGVHALLCQSRSRDLHALVQTMVWIIFRAGGVLIGNHTNCFSDLLTVNLMFKTLLARPLCPKFLQREAQFSGEAYPRERKDMNFQMSTFRAKDRVPFQSSFPFPTTTTTTTTTTPSTPSTIAATKVAVIIAKAAKPPKASKATSSAASTPVAVSAIVAGSTAVATATSSPAEATAN
jgi:hypothetical protein